MLSPELNLILTCRPSINSAWRTYFPYTDDSRTFLCNESDHEFLLLEELSSDIWHMISTDNTEAQWQEFLSQNDISTDELNDFIQELADSGLISSANHIKNTNNQPTITSNAENSETTSANTLESEMKNWVESKGLIYAVHWEMTYRCNEVCIHCYNPGAAHEIHEKPQRNTDELTTQEALHLLEIMAEQGVMRLTLTGGEVTLRKDFLQILARARNLGFMVVIFTNGLKIKDTLLTQIAELWPHGIEISIYSHIPEKHDAITGVKGSFERSLQTLRKFRESGIRTTYKTTLMKTTVADYHETRELGIKSAESVILTTMMSPGVDGKKAPLNHALSFSQLIALSATPESPLYVGNQKEGWRKANLNNRKMKPCGAGHASLAVTPDGDIFPCLAFPMKLGNIRTTGFEGVVQQQKSRPISPVKNFSELSSSQLLAAWQSIRIEDLRECGTHDRCEWCGDICPGDAYVQTKDPLAAAENHCREAYARMTASQEINSGLSLTDIYIKYDVTTDFGLTTQVEKPIKWHS